MMASLQAEFLRVCETGYLERVKQLLGEGVDINTQNNVCIFDEFVFLINQCLQALTPLHYACYHGHVEVVTVLVRAGAQIDAQDRVWTVEIRVDLSSSVWMGLPSIMLALEVMWKW
jgi:hypothetical protein